MDDDKKDTKPELTDFQLRNISILRHLYEHDAVTDEIVEFLRQAELDYFALIDKYKLLEKKINVDEKTNILKFKTDYLTNIIKTASRVYYGIKKSQFPICLIRFDIDDFSLFNNKYGHELGDEVLIRIARILRDRSRPTDYVIRFGGEEFDVILPSTDSTGATAYLEKIFREIRGLQISYQSQKLSVSVSAGFTEYLHVFNDSFIIDDQAMEQEFKRLQTQADDALYEAKSLGKDRYCRYSPDKKEDYCRMREAYCRK